MVTVLDLGGEGPAPSISPPRSDGRNKRAETTRKAILEAAYTLTMEGGAVPAMSAIVIRADRSVRSGFQHFTTIDQLMLAVLSKITVSVTQKGTLAVGRVEHPSEQFVAMVLDSVYSDNESDLCVAWVIFRDCASSAEIKDRYAELERALWDQVRNALGLEEGAGHELALRGLCDVGNWERLCGLKGTQSYRSVTNHIANAMARLIEDT